MRVGEKPTQYIFEIEMQDFISSLELKDIYIYVYISV